MWPSPRGLPVTVSPKFCRRAHGHAVPSGLDPRAGNAARRDATGLMALSTGTRSFTRYSYADLMREDRQVYSVLHRIWPGTQRLLLWGDPVTAAAYARAFEICGSSGVGDHGAAVIQRAARLGQVRRAVRLRGCLAQSALGLGEISQYLSRLGPSSVQPEARPDVAGNARTALESAEPHSADQSRRAHAPSAANNTYWPEIYTQPADGGSAPQAIRTPIRRRPKRSAMPAHSTRSCSWA